jgi:predicted nucleotidyltransferase
VPKLSFSEAIASSFPDLPLLSESERRCLQRYVDLLVETLGGTLAEVVLFGSVARGESWPRAMRIRSDFDILVVTDSQLPDAVVASLIDGTLPLFLECGRQIGPVFRTRKELAQPKDDRTAAFLENVKQDAVPLYRRGGLAGF